MVRKYLVTEDEFLSATVTVAGDLTFTRDNGEVIVAGSVKGDQGDQGIPGPNTVPTEVAIAASIAAKILDGSGDRLIAVDEANYKLPDPVLDALGADIPDTSTAVGASVDSLLSQRSGLVVRSVGSDSANVTALQAALVGAAAFGVPVRILGNIAVNNLIDIPTGAIFDGELGTLTQTGTLKTLLRVTNSNNVSIRNLRAVGKRTDYQNTNNVYPACAVLVNGTSKDVQIDGGSLIGFAGAGVRIEGSASVQVRGVKIEGPGATYITGSTFNFGAGIVGLSTASWGVRDCEISEFAQGIVTGDGLVDVTVVHNHIHHIRGQHGAYIESVDRLQFTSNTIHDCVLAGMKVQIGATSAPDPQDFIVANNIIKSVGAQGILLTNPVGGSPRLRRGIIADNVINAAVGGGIEVNNTIGLNIGNNSVDGCKFGLLLQSSSSVSISNLTVRNVAESGIIIRGSSDVSMRGYTVAGAGITAQPASQFGVLIDSTSADLTLVGGKITAAGSTTMRYGIYVSAGTQTSMSFIDNDVSGASDYGWRGIAATATRAFRGNIFAGTAGAMLNPPSSFVQIADATNATDVITQLNALLAVARSNGLIRV